MSKWHFNRSWNTEDPFVDECGCVRAPCGFAVEGNANCPEHGFNAAKSIRQMHNEEACKARNE